MEGGCESCSEVNSQDTKFGFRFFDDFSEDAIHPLLIDDFEDEVETKRKLRAGNIYKPADGLTLLHQTLRDGDEFKIKLLIDVYQEDFEKVGSYLEKEYQWNSDDRVWLKKNILISSSEMECRTAKSLENKRISGEDIHEAVFILLLHPVQDEEVAILHPDESTQLPVIQLINRLLPNGFLSWSYHETQECQETFMETAASRGLNHVIDRLYGLGASIAIPEHNPLLSACKSNKMDTIQWLLTRHFDNFNCTFRDVYQNNALIVAMQKDDAKMFNFCLEKMIAYRQRYYNETESEAFSRVFRFEVEDLENLSIFAHYCKGPVGESIKRAIEKYGIDLAYQWKGVTILVCMLCRNIALNYCFEGIRKNPKLLGMVSNGSTKVLHHAMRFKHLKFLLDMYEMTPEVKKYFNGDAGFQAMSDALLDQDQKTVQFILTHHKDFLKSDEPKLKEILFSNSYSKDYFDNNYKLLMRYFPEYKEEIKHARVLSTQRNSFGKFKQNDRRNKFHKSEGSFKSIGIDVSKLDDLPKPYSNNRGSKGETLLHLAVENDNKELLIKLIEAGCGLDTLDNEGNHPIHFVQSESMLDLIIDQHPEGRNLIHRTNQEGFSVLHKVCSLRMEDKPLISLLEKVINFGADVHQHTNEGESVVFFLGSCDALEVFRKHNVQLDTATKNGETALLRHLRLGTTWMTRALLPHFHQLPTFKEHAHKYLETMLSCSCDFFEFFYQDSLVRYPEMTKLMFDSLFKHSREEASRVFSMVCGSAHNFASEKFLEFDYDLDYNYPGRNQNTPIVGLLSHFEGPNKHIVEKLLQKDVNLHIRNNRGQDALLAFVDRFPIAKWWSHDAETIQLLVDHGATVNTADEDGNTPLHLAVRDGEFKLIEVLVRNGADVRATNKAGKVPLLMATAANRELFYFLR